MVSYATSFADRTPSSTSTVVESNDSTAKRQASPSPASDLPRRVHGMCPARARKSRHFKRRLWGHPPILDYRNHKPETIQQTLERVD